MSDWGTTQSPRTIPADSGSGAIMALRTRHRSDTKFPAFFAISRGGQTMLSDHPSLSVSDKLGCRVLLGRGWTMKWWARQDSNLRPRDSLFPAVSGWSGLSHHPSGNVRRLPSGCGTLEPVIKDTQSPQVVSAPSGGAPPAWLRIAANRIAAVSLNSSRSSHIFRCERTVVMSPPL